jgi:hypothetical protein
MTNAIATDTKITTSVSLVQTVNNFGQKEYNCNTPVFPVPSPINCDFKSGDLNETYKKLIKINTRYLLNEVNFNFIGFLPNSFNYNFTSGNIEYSYNQLPLTLITSYEISNQNISLNTPQQIPLYDSFRTQTINNTLLSSGNNNGFYHINDNTFNILATTYSVQYSFGGEFIFIINSSSLEENDTYKIIIDALIDSNSNPIVTTSFKKDTTSQTTNVKVNLFSSDVILILNMKPHTINLSWTITSENAINNINNINILNTTGSYFEFIADNTALCNV